MAFGNPPRHSFEDPPPHYSFWDVTGPKGEKLTDVRNNKHIARRGGWRRICLIALVVLAVIVALAVGLGVGLHKNHKAPATAPSTTPEAAPANRQFPVGNYTVNTFLETTSTDCTSNATTWQCPPYHTYADSPSESKAEWNFIINPASDPSEFTISTTQNYFSIMFSDIPLELIDHNHQIERYHFSTQFRKLVNPLINEYCYFNDTTVEGDLYTKLKQVHSNASYSSTVAPSMPTPTAVSFSGGQNLWPFAAEITVSHGGGLDVPDCHQWTDGELGPRLTQGITAQATTDLCSCFYKNFNP